ncbi:MAG: hypothetical protein ABEI31_10345 [Halodesulfurarchaeum sp.]
MERRVPVLMGVVLLAALAGCSGGGGGGEFSLEVAHEEIGQSADGYLVFNVTITNSGNQAQRGTLYVTADLNGNQTVRVREVSLDPHQTTEVTIRYNVTYRNVTKFVPESSIEPPQ